MLATTHSPDVLRRKCGCEGSGACSCNAQRSVASVVRQGLATTSQPLDASLRRQMEGAFGQPFDGVRVHNDANAAASARAVDARAYTVGRHIVFDHGAYAPHSSEGKKLLAHELTHVVQQAGTEVIPTRLGSEHDEAERVADRAAEGVAIQRDEEPALRRTPTSQVSCAKYAPLKIPDVPPIVDPVAEITEAEDEAQTYLDEAIFTLEREIEKEARWKFTPVPSPSIAKALPYVGIDPYRKTTWHGKGVGTASLLLRRLNLVRRTIGAGTFFYVCWGKECKDNVWASGPGKNVMRLCPRFWRSELPVRALTIIHESFHNFFGWMLHGGRWTFDIQKPDPPEVDGIVMIGAVITKYIKEVGESNAHCYERLVQLLAGVDDKYRTDTCKEP
jgi:hypothetical protein